MIQFDASVMQTLAQSLYAQAASVERTGAIIGALVGIMGGGALTTIADLPLVLGAGFGAMLGGALGFSMARSRAFLLRVEAQKLLCQVQIEANTRQLA